MTGGAQSGVTFAAWGDSLFVWRDTRLQFQRKGHFGEGGCLTDVDGDGQPDVVVTEAGIRPGLVWFRGTDGKRSPIDSGVVASDVIAATFHGRSGVLVLHKAGQLRFYYRENGAWASRDLYSFYSAVDQGGLLLSDVDGDGRMDIFCGNYWVRQPESFELPWRLFAIKLWSEDRSDAITDFAWAGDRLLAVQRHKAPALSAWYRKPADPKLLWPDDVVSGIVLSRPRVAGVRGGAVLVAEGAGEGRFVWLHTDGGHRVAMTGPPIVRAWLRDREVYAITTNSVRVMRLEQH